MKQTEECHEPLVSIILITYNRKAYLSETINSILSQTYKNYELIVVDNYSDYDFFGLIESFHSNKIIPFQNQNHGTIAINRNYGIAKAKGQYLAFCDDDDIWYPNKLEVQINYILNHNVDIISSALMLFGEDITEEHVFYKKYSGRMEIYQRNLLTPSSVIVKNSNIVRFDENPDFNCSEDWALWTKLITLGYRLYQFPEPLVRYRVFSSNLTKKNKIQPDFKAIRILKKLKFNYPHEFSNRFYYPAIIYHFIKGCVRETMRLFK